MLQDQKEEAFSYLYDNYASALLGIINQIVPDTDTAQDVYRYDAERGALTRLSIGADGEGGNASGQDARLAPFPLATPTRPRVVMTDDGGSVARDGGMPVKVYALTR